MFMFMILLCLCLICILYKPDTSASEHLLEERDKLDNKIQLMQEERDLINKHLTDQKRKQDEILQSELSLKERSLLVRNTLNNLQVRGLYLKLSYCE